MIAARLLLHVPTMLPSAVAPERLANPTMYDKENYAMPGLDCHLPLPKKRRRCPPERCLQTINRTASAIQNQGTSAARHLRLVQHLVDGVEDGLA
eukprot:6184633-Pleurochrysis_carterae.AAC.3